MTFPYLHQLMARFGGYTEITAEGWRVFDAEVAAWRQAYREKLISLRKGRSAEPRGAKAGGAK